MNNQPKFKKGDSPVVDMLAIPDDHVWPVEWKRLEGSNATGVVLATGNGRGVEFINAKQFPTGIFTHYLTEADLLKLPFQQ